LALSVSLVSLGGPPNLVREVTAVSRCGMAIEREKFVAAGGFDEEKFADVYHDVDLCLRLRSRGLRNIFTPFAKLNYFATSRRGCKPKPFGWSAIKAETETLVQLWPHEFAGDAFFNFNLSLRSTIPVPRVPRKVWPWQQG
jgi:GT2 family glycosyltransferase